MDKLNPSGEIYQATYILDEQTGKRTAVKVNPIAFGPGHLDGVSLYFEGVTPSSTPGDITGSGWYPIVSWDGCLVGVFIPDELLSSELPEWLIGEEIHKALYPDVPTMMFRTHLPDTQN